MLKELESGGFVEARRGKGVFISKRHAGKKFNENFTGKIDGLINEAKRLNIDSGELIRFISARIAYPVPVKKPKGLLVMGINRELVDVNLQKLREAYS